MNDKTLFMIVDKQVLILQNSSMDHREWYVSLGFDSSRFDSLIRGFIIEHKIVFFKGSTFNYDDEVIQAAMTYASSIRERMQDPTLEVYCGIVIPESGTKWEPVMRITEEEIQNFSPKVEEKKDKTEDFSNFENGPIIEFKNNYEDPVFQKRAIIISGIVLVITVILKIILFSQQKILQTNNFIDMLLVLAQVLLLSFTIYGYYKKLSFAKYLGVASSVFIILTFDFLDIVIGVLYFIFQVDQAIFSRFFDFLKGLGGKIKDRKKS